MSLTVIPFAFRRMRGRTSEEEPSGGSAIRGQAAFSRDAKDCTVPRLANDTAKTPSSPPTEIQYEIDQNKPLTKCPYPFMSEYVYGVISPYKYSRFSIPY